MLSLPVSCMFSGSFAVKKFAQFNLASCQPFSSKALLECDQSFAVQCIQRYELRHLNNKHIFPAIICGDQR
jgi:hypothetical protein